MKRIMCVRLVSWPIDRFKRQHRRRDDSHRTQPPGAHPPGNEPLVLVDVTGTRQTVAALCPAARASGVRVGMNVAEAHALCRGLVHARHEADKDARGLEALGRWLMRFTPAVALEAGDALFLDVGGCERLFGGLDRLWQQVVDALRTLRLHARVVIAPTAGAAWALTHRPLTPPQLNMDAPPIRKRPDATAQAVDSSEHGNVSTHGSTACAVASKPRTLRAAPSAMQPHGLVSEDQLLSKLSQLPPTALRIAPPVAAMLHKLGVETIGQLIALPRDALPARFGGELLRRLDQAIGRVAEPLTLLPHPSPVRAVMRFDGPIDALEAVWLVLKKLVAEVVAELSRRNAGARQLHVRFERDKRPPVENTVLLSRANRDGADLFNLLRSALETLQTNSGFTGIVLSVLVFECTSHEQTALLGQEENDQVVNLERLVERLRARLGKFTVEAAEPVESHLPERACRYVEAIDRPAPSVKRLPPAIPNPPDPDARPPRAPRPLHLLTPPTEIGVTVTPSEDRDGQPASFTHRGDVHRVTYAIGPERIAGVWWDGHYKTRDYFEVENQAGQCLWIFRVNDSSRWFLHGNFG